MSHRIGECSACGAVFKLPASFAHDQARCTKCGGVVNIAPSGSETPQPVPAKRVAQKAAAPQAAAPSPSASPPKKERSGPSMKEKILARKQAEAAAKPAAARAAAPKARTAARPAAKSAAKPTARATSKASGRAPAKASAGATARGKSAAPAKTERASARSGAGRTRSSARGSRAREGQEVVEGDVPYRDRVKAQRKKNSVLSGIVAVVLLAAVGGGAWWYVNQDPDPANAATGDGGTEGVATAGPGLEEPGTAGDQLAAGDGDSSDGGMDDPGTDGSTDESTTDDAASSADMEPTEDAPAAAPKPPKAERTNADVDLTAIADFDKLPETTEEEWDAIRQDVADGFDLDAGASAGRARGRLETLGKPAFPAILNAFKQVDVSTETGHRVGDLFQKTLERICNGTNLGWKYPGEPEQFYFNAAVIKGWCAAWDAAKDDEAKWLKLSKQTESAEEKTEEAPKDDSGLDAGDFDFDD